MDWTIRGSNPAGGMDVCVVCCTVKDKRHSQDNQDTALQLKYREPRKKNPGGGRIFSTLWGPHSVL